MRSYRNLDPMLVRMLWPILRAADQKLMRLRLEEDDKFVEKERRIDLVQKLRASMKSQIDAADTHAEKQRLKATHLAVIAKIESDTLLPSETYDMNIDVPGPWLPKRHSFGDHALLCEEQLQLQPASI